VANRHHVLRDLHNANLDPRKAHRRLGSHGHLAPEEVPAVEPPAEAEMDCVALVRLSLREISAELATGEWDDHLDQVLQAEDEQRQKPRVSLKRIVNERREQIC